MPTGNEPTDSPLVGRTTWPIDDALLRLATTAAASLPAPFAFSHTTAARLLGWPVPWEADVCGDVHVIRTSDGSRVKRPSVQGHRGLESRRVVRVADLPVVAPADTWVDLGELVGPGRPFVLGDIIAAGDQALNAGCTANQLSGIVSGRNRPRGSRMLLPALPWLRAGSESWGETMVRLILQRAGLPIPLLNKNIYNVDGRFLFRPDLSWPARRVAVEYQGAQVHNTPGAVMADELRFTRGEHHGWTFFEVRSGSIWVRSERDRVISQIASALEFPLDRLDLDAAEPQIFTPQFAATLVENRRRRRARRRAAWMAAS